MTIPDTVQGFIDWTRRPPFRLEEADGPTAEPRETPTLTGGHWTITTRFPGEILTADKYNADRQLMVDNAVPLMIDDYSVTVAQMQASTNPFPGGAPSLATTLAGELERIRYVLASLNPDGHWYEVPTRGISPAGGFKLDNAESLLGQRTDGSYGSLVMMGGDDSIYVGWDLPAGEFVSLGTTASAGVYVPSYLSVVGGASIRGNLMLQKGNWLYWDDIYAIAVDAGNGIFIGGNAANITMEKYTFFPAGADITGLTVESALQVNGPAALNSTLNVQSDAILGGTLYAAGHVSMAAGLTMTKDLWIYWGDMQGIVVSAGNVLSIGGNTASIALMAPYTQVNGILTVLNTIRAPDISAGNGNGVVDGITSVRAWARWADAFYGQHGFASAVYIGIIGSEVAWRFTLDRPYPNGYAVAVTIEGGGNGVRARVTVENTQQFVVLLSDAAGNPATAAMHLLVAGRL